MVVARRLYLPVAIYRRRRMFRRPLLAGTFRRLTFLPPGISRAQQPRTFQPEGMGGVLRLVLVLPLPQVVAFLGTLLMP